MAIDKTETHIVPSIPESVRLQEYGVGVFVGAPTKSALKKALKKELVTVDGRIATTATYITGGETICLSIPAEVKKGRTLDLTLEVIYEDEYMAVVHKPAGVLVSGNNFRTIKNALPQNVRPSGRSDAAVPQPVHRLDYATTGALLVGKTSGSIRALNKMFENKKVIKTYYAIAIGEMKTEGSIAEPIDSKTSQTDYSVIKSTPSDKYGLLNLVNLRPLTGRRHQLRKHLSQMGNPILGDQDYGREGLILKGKGMYLHAYSIEFIHPFSGRHLIIKDPLPRKFEKIFPESSSSLSLE